MRNPLQVRQSNQQATIRAAASAETTPMQMS